MAKKKELSGEEIERKLIELKKELEAIPIEVREAKAREVITKGHKYYDVKIDDKTGTIKHFTEIKMVGDTLEEALVSWEDFKEIVEALMENNESEPYINLPCSSVTNIAKKILNNPANVSSPRRGQIKKSEHYLTGDSIITYKGSDCDITIELGRTKELFNAKTKKGHGPKVFNFFLEKLNEQHRQEKTTFLLQELIDRGIYKSKDTAYRGLKLVTDRMMAISMEGIISEYSKGKQKKEIRNAKANMIAQRDISYNACTVSFPPIIRDSTKYITILPRWSYGLSENAFMLLDYIFYMARVNAADIKKNRHFNINMDAIRAQLGLPELKECARPQQLIINPIEEAIGDIRDVSGRRGINIVSCYNQEHYKNAHEYLSGYIQIELDEEAQQYMEERALAQEEEYKKAQKRIEKAKQKTENERQAKLLEEADTLKN